MWGENGIGQQSSILEKPTLLIGSKLYIHVGKQLVFCVFKIFFVGLSITVTFAYENYIQNVVF